MNGLDINGAKMAGKDITKIVGVPIVIGQPKEPDPGDVPADYDTIAQIDAPGEESAQADDGSITDQKDLVHSAALKIIDRASKAPGSLSGFSCKIAQIDRALDGFQRGMMYGCGGRPGMGKSVFALQIALNTAQTGVGVYYVSLEMPSLQHGLRMLFNNSTVESWRWKEGKMRKEDWDAITGCVPFVASLPIVWDQKKGQTIEDVAKRIKSAKARFAAKDQSLGLVIIDHALLIKGSVKGDARAQYVHMTHQLKEEAERQDVAILALAQLNRNSVARGVKDKRPQMSDFKETGSWEEDADAMLLLYRDDYFEKDKTKWNHRIEVNIPKNRDGERSFVELKFEEFCQRVVALESDEPPPGANNPPNYQDPDA